MRMDCRVKHDVEVRRKAVELFATEQVFGHLKDEFFRGRTWPNFESFKVDLDAYVT